MALVKATADDNLSLIKRCLDVPGDSCMGGLCLYTELELFHLAIVATGALYASPVVIYGWWNLLIPACTDLQCSS